MKIGFLKYVYRKFFRMCIEISPMVSCRSWYSKVPDFSNFVQENGLEIAEIFRGRDLLICFVEILCN